MRLVLMPVEGLPSAPQAPPPTAHRKRRSQQKPSAPTIAAQSRPTFTLAVLDFLRAELPPGCRSLPTEGLGWKAVEELWGLTPPDFDTVVLSHLTLKPAPLQQQILLAFATANLANVQNPSGFLMRVLQQVEVGTPVCLLYLAGGCPPRSGCTFHHPSFSKGWQTLWTRWRASLEDFDYLVLNSLFQHSVEQQNRILWRLASMRLKSVKNASALLHSIIHQTEQLRSPSTESPPAHTPNNHHSDKADVLVAPLEVAPLTASNGPLAPPPAPHSSIVLSKVVEALSVGERVGGLQQMEVLQFMMRELLQDALRNGLEVDMELVHEALPGMASNA